MTLNGEILNICWNIRWSIEVFFKRFENNLVYWWNSHNYISRRIKSLLNISFWQKDFHKLWLFYSIYSILRGFLKENIFYVNLNIWIIYQFLLSFFHKNLVRSEMFLLLVLLRDHGFYEHLQCLKKYKSLKEVTTKVFKYSFSNLT